MALREVYLIKARCLFGIECFFDRAERKWKCRNRGKRTRVEIVENEQDTLIRSLCNAHGPGECVQTRTACHRALMM